MLDDVSRETSLLQWVIIYQVLYLGSLKSLYSVKNRFVS